MKPTREQKERVFRAAMRLWNSRRAHLKKEAHGFDFEGAYWIIRDAAPMREFRAACVAAQAGNRKKNHER